MSTYRRTGLTGSGLATEDIAGAQPRTLHREIDAVKPAWNEPLNRPRRLHPPHLHTNSERPVMNLTNRDIAGSIPRGTSGRGNRQTNPLQPDYQLSSFEHRPYTPPAKQARNMCLNTTDIEGTAPGSRFVPSGRNGMDTTDITGTSSGWKPANTRYFSHSSNHAQANTRRQHTLSQSNQLYVTDINEGQFRTSASNMKSMTNRNIDPLAPTYTYDVENRERWPATVTDDSEPVTIGPIAKSFPTPARSLRVDPEYNLMTGDIPGARAGWRAKVAPRRDFSNTN